MYREQESGLKRVSFFSGTVETWLIWKLTKGRVHVTDYSNASRMMSFNINTLQWDDEILKELGIPKCMLPEPKPSSCIYGEADASYFGGNKSQSEVLRGISSRHCSVRRAFRQVRQKIHMERAAFY